MTIEVLQNMPAVDGCVYVPAETSILVFIFDSLCSNYATGWMTGDVDWY